MKKLLTIAILVISSTNIFAQNSPQINYQNLKRMVDGSMGDAVNIFKTLGFEFYKSEETFVTYRYVNSGSIYLGKSNSGFVYLGLFGKKRKYLSDEILATIKKIGYKEIGVNTDDNQFCTQYDSTNYIMEFCDGKLEYDTGYSDLKYSILMLKK